MNILRITLNSIFFKRNSKSCPAVTKVDDIKHLCQVSNTIEFIFVGVATDLCRVKTVRNYYNSFYKQLYDNSYFFTLVVTCI